VIVGHCAVCGLELDDAVMSIVAHVECVKQRAKRRRKGISDDQGTL
jgi:hypothetical protein